MKHHPGGTPIQILRYSTYGEALLEVKDLILTTEEEDYDYEIVSKPASSLAVFYCRYYRLLEIR